MEGGGGRGGSNNQIHWNMANAASGVWGRGDNGGDGKGQVSKWVFFRPVNQCDYIRVTGKGQ